MLRIFSPDHLDAQYSHLGLELLDKVQHVKVAVTNDEVGISYNSMQRLPGRVRIKCFLFFAKLKIST
jgi:hypothetical protein